MECPWYGSRQTARHLRRAGHEIGRRRTRRLMAKMGLTPIYQRPRTSDPHPQHRVYPYLLRKLAIERPKHVWCVDVTYIPMRRGFLYLVALMDWASRKVLAWRLSNTMDAGFCVEALEEALARFGKPEIFGSGQSVHQQRLHRRSAGGRDQDQHGWPGTLDGQCLHRAALAVPEIRMRLMSQVPPTYFDPYETPSLPFLLPRCRRSAIPSGVDQFLQFLKGSRNDGIFQKAVFKAEDAMSTVLQLARDRLWRRPYGRKAMSPATVQQASCLPLLRATERRRGTMRRMSCRNAV